MLRSLIANGMLVEIEDDVFSFRHALAREAIEADLLGREKRRLHEQALAALRDVGRDDLGAIAHHALGAGRYDEMIEAAEARRAQLSAERIHVSVAAARRARAQRSTRRSRLS